jgi:hypothetical protein
MKSKSVKVAQRRIEVSIVVLIVIEEVGHCLGQILMVVGVRDEVFTGAIDTFAAEQGAGRDAAKDLKNNILREAGLYVPLVGGILYYVSVQ